MECIFLEEGKYCIGKFLYFTPSWEVDDDTMKRYCVTGKFADCPRYKAYMEYLEKSTAEEQNEADE